MRIPFIRFFLLVSIMLLPSLHGAEDTNEAKEKKLYRPPAPVLPELLAKLPDARISRSDFQNYLSGILNSKIQVPLPPLAIPSRLTADFIMLDMAAHKYNLKINEEVLQKAVLEEERKNGGREHWDRILAHKRKTRGDWLRAYRLSKMAQMLEKHEPDPQALRQNYAPRFYGFDRPTTASVGQRDFTRNEALNFFIANASDAYLNSVLTALLHERILKRELKNITGEVVKKNLGTDEVNKLLKKIYAPFFTKSSLLQYYENKKELFAIVQGQRFFIKYPSGQLSTEEKEQTRKKAEKMYEKALKNPDALQTDAASPEMGYFYLYPGTSHSIPPLEYGFDYIQTDRGQLNPIRTLPEGVLQIFRKLKKGEIAKPVKTSKGYFIFRRQDTRYPRQPEKIMPVIDHLRSQEEKKRLLEGLYKNGLKIEWKASDRFSKNLLYPKNDPGLNPPGIISDELPELE